MDVELRRDLAEAAQRRERGAGPLRQPIITSVVSALHRPPIEPREEQTICERCGAEMYRMHAVWRCPSCRFKTDCCGW
jgi:rubrerythrin